MVQFLIATRFGWLDMGTMGREQAEELDQSQSGPVSGRALLALLAANLALALGPWFVRMTDVGPTASAFWRMVLALPVLFLLSGRLEGRVAVPKPLLFALGVAGLLFAADLASWHSGITMTKLANATLFGNMASLLYPLYGFMIIRQWPSRMQGLAMLLAFIGGALLMGQSYDLSQRNLIGDLLALAAGIFYAFYLIAMERARSVFPPWNVLAWSTMASAVPLLIAAILFGEQIWPGDWRPLIALAVMSQLVGQGLLILSLGRVPPLIVGLAFLTQPFVSAVIGWFAYGEGMALHDWVGGGLVAAALILVQLRAKQSSA